MSGGVGESLLIRGVPIQFPYTTYGVQQVMMERVLEAVQEQKDALLESPTGTGKTACLLVAVLAWQQSLRADESSAVPRVFYSSRTHSQLQKVIRELGSTSYRPRMTLQGSRNQLCIHPTVEAAKGPLKSAMCRSLVGSGRCDNFESVAVHVAKRPHVAEVTDIEDLVAAGRRDHVCPYYLSRERTKTADITFLPYNYLIDPLARRHMAEELNGAVLIFDEAHNLDSVCADASSFDLRDADVAECIESINGWGKVFPEDAKVAVAQVPRLSALLSCLQGVSSGDHAGVVLPQCFERSGITMQEANEVVECLEDVSAARAEAGLGVGGLQAMIGALKVMFATPGQLGETAMSVARFYRTHVSPLDRDKSRTFSYWCFHPGLALRVLRAQHGVRCVILASGTLSPMDALASELGSPFPVRLENPHVIHSSQVWAGVVSYGPAAIKMENTYNNRTNRDHLRDLGMAIVNFCRIVPDGLLVFFPSYAHLDLCVSSWQEAGESVWSGILKHKRVVQEPRLASQSAAAIAEFQAMINDGSSRGVVFLAVFRGKVAEGLDFSDRNGRAVVIVGVPFPSTMDARIVAKKKFLDTEKRSNPLMLSGEEWYLQQAACAVNQAIGRVIRHRFDYGAMIFLDARFETLVTEAAKPFVSTWIRPFVKVFNEFGKATVSLTRFFRNTPKQVEELRKAAELESAKHAATVVSPGKDRKRSALAVREVEVKEDVKMQKIQQAQGFLSTAKNALGPDKFSVFQQSLRKYKAKDITIQRVICDCLPVFLSVEDLEVRAELLKGFESFIPTKYHAEFHQIAADMQKADEVKEKKPVKRTSHVREEPSSSTKPVLDRLVKERKKEQQEAVALASSKVPIVVGSSSPGDAIAAPAATASAVAATTGAKPDASTPSKPHCPICLEPFKSPFSAVCGHICCHACWQNWLQQKLECPVCKEKVRSKQLRKVSLFVIYIF